MTSSDDVASSSEVKALWRERLSIAARIAAVLATLRLALAVVPVAHARVTFPFDIDWIEGGQLAHAARILEGRPIYGAPDFLPHPYPPLHYVVLAAAGAVTHLDFTVARVISVASVLVALALIVWMLHRCVTTSGAKRSLLASAALAAAAVGLTLRTYEYSVGWYDLARSDSLLLAFLAGACALSTDARRLPFAGLLLAAAIYTKQTAIFVVLPLALVVARRSWREALVLTLACVVPSALVFAWLEITSGGTFHTWLLSTRGHPVELERLASGLWLVLRASPLLAIVPLLAWIARGRVSAQSWAMFALWVGAVPACLLPFAKVFGAQNNLVPLFAFSAVLPLFFLVDAMRALRRGAVIFEAGLAGATLLIAASPVDLGRLAPPREVARAMAQNLEEVRALPGTIACPVHPFLGPLLGKGDATPSWHAYLDAGSAGRPVSRENVVRALLDKRADWIILTNMSIEWTEDLQGAIGREYDWDHNFSTPAAGRPPTFYSMPRMAFRRRAPR